MSVLTSKFLLDALQSLNYDVDGVSDETPLGPDGLDLESLTLAEVLMLIEEQFGVHVDEDETERLAGLTVGEFVSALTARSVPEPTSA
ncbi:acyl carrier protein [Streptomyces sp. NBC_00289]|uniref:acyl carrier protein n=1 Tax=Streptomyces sp. NBC_00289 TaxID=2975703 RepID=UPI0032541F40